MRILIATGNANKVNEYRLLFASLNFELVSPTDIGLPDFSIDESGLTFEENALLKATAYMKKSGLPALADDSGLMVDALGGAPGIHSARYGGSGLDHSGKRKKLLAAMQGLPAAERGARFICVIALALPKLREPLLFRGECRGRITTEEYDEGNGFGYDPVFQPASYDQTFGQMSSEQKSDISHRSIAASKAIPVLCRLARQLA